MGANHDASTGIDNHPITFATVADAAALAALTPTAADVEKVVHQTDTGQVWFLLSIGPPVWADMTGGIDTAEQETLDDIASAETDLGNSGASLTINFVNYRVRVTLTADAAVTMGTAPRVGHYQVKVLTGGGGFTPTFTNVDWARQTAYTGTQAAASTDFLSLYYDGTTWFGQFTLDFG